MPEPIVSVAGLREREKQTWAAGVTRESVIRRAGVAVSQVAYRLTRTADPVLVLAGRGHNGDDAVVAEEHLGDRDNVLLRFNSSALIEDAQTWLRTFKKNRRALIIDGLFGLGLNRPVEGEWADLIRSINASGIRVLSVDVPSGLDADTGHPRGVAVEAMVTLTLGSVKAGLLRDEAARYVGRLELATDIGLVTDPGAPTDRLWTLASDFAGFPPRRHDHGHKGTYGHTAIIAGSLGYHGAAVLAAQGALRARPGLVTVLTDERCYLPVAAQLSSAMVRPWSGEPLENDDFTALVVGPGLASPGLSPSARAEVQRLWQHAKAAVVADASALDWLPTELSSEAGPRVITPHPGEAGRLLQISAAEVQADRFAAVRALASRWSGGRVVAVLKGRHTLVAGAHGPIHVNPSGNPGLAQGGSGDVLAGYLGGLLAQPELLTDLGRTVRYGVWRHGAAADALELQGDAWNTEDLERALGSPVD